MFLCHEVGACKLAHQQSAARGTFSIPATLLWPVHTLGVQNGRRGLEKCQILGYWTRQKLYGFITSYPSNQYPSTPQKSQKPKLDVGRGNLSIVFNPSHKCMFINTMNTFHSPPYPSKQMATQNRTYDRTYNGMNKWAHARIQDGTQGQINVRIPFLKLQLPLFQRKFLNHIPIPGNL